MRRILIGILLCMLALGAQAITYGELEWAVEARVNASKRNKPDASTLLPHILQGLPVRVNIELPKGNGTAPVQCSNVKKDVTKSYNDWFKNAINTIKAQHREQEFQDVLPVLRQGVSLEVICVSGNASSGAEPPNIILILKNNLKEVRELCGRGTYGCMKKGTPMKIILTQEDMYTTSLTHELGHTLGLADNNQTPFGSNSSDIYGSRERTTDNIMGLGNELTADDADGLINIIDAWTVYNAKKKHPRMWQKYVSPRILNGWDSLYRNPTTGAPFDRYVIGTTEELKEIAKDY